MQVLEINLVLAWDSTANQSAPHTLSALLRSTRPSPTSLSCSLSYPRTQSYWCFTAANTSLKPLSERSGRPEALSCIDWHVWAPTPDFSPLWLVRRTRLTQKKRYIRYIRGRYLRTAASLFSESGSQRSLRAPLHINKCFGAHFKLKILEKNIGKKLHSVALIRIIWE